MKRLLILQAVLLAALGLPCAAQLPARKPSISSAPKYEGSGDANHFTTYHPADEKRTAADVMRITSNLSFISRALRVLSRDGASKHFEMITGEDGITFGISDFAGDDLVHRFFAELKTKFPSEYQHAFGANGDQLADLNKVKKLNNKFTGPRKNDGGLITEAWVRTGLDEILTNSHLREFQLSVFLEEPVTPCLNGFKTLNMKLEFTLAALIGVGNSFGGDSAVESLAKLKSGHPGESELQLVRRLLEHYAGTSNPKIVQTLDRGFSGMPMLPLGESEMDQLGHRGKRIWQLFDKFPLSAPVNFSTVGEFQLGPDDHT